MTDLPDRLNELPAKVTGSFIKNFLKYRYRKVLLRLCKGEKELPEGTANARLVLFHGYSKHADTIDMQRMRHVLQRDGRFDLFYCDLPYHGQSIVPGNERTRGKIKHFLRLIEAVFALTLKTLSRPYPRPIPVFLLGYSTGALAIVRFLQEYPTIQKYIAGIILVAPPLRLDHNAHELIRKYRPYIEGAARWARYVPYLADVKVGDIGVGDLEDKLEFNARIDLRSSMEMHIATIDAKRALKEIKLPALFLHGEKDRTALMRDARDAFDLIGTPPELKRFIQYPNAEHGLLDEHKSRVDVTKDIIAWMSEITARKEWQAVEYEALANDIMEMSAETVFFGRRVLTIFQNMLLRWLRKLRFWSKNTGS